MEFSAHGGAAMNWICWWLVDVSSQMLEPAERDAVVGDLSECGEPGLRAIHDVLGLVVRRQAVLWSNWRAWAILAGLMVPLGMLLSVISRNTAGEAAVYTWLYANNTDWALLRNGGFWYVFAGSAKAVFIMCLILVCRSWTAGMVLGVVSGKIIRINGVLFFLTLLFGELAGAPQYLAFYWQQMHRIFPLPMRSDQHAPVQALLFYRVIFPLIVQIALVAVPAILGMRQGAKVSRLVPPLRPLVWTAAISTLIVMVIQAPGFGLFLNAYRYQVVWLRLQSSIQILQFVAYWPLLYWATKAIEHNWQRKTMPFA